MSQMSVWPQLAVRILIGGSQSFPSNLPFPWRFMAPHVRITQCYTWYHTTVPAKRHLFPSNGFTKIHECDRQTDRQTDRPCYGITCRNSRTILSLMPPKTVHKTRRHLTYIFPHYSWIHASMANDVPVCVWCLSVCLSVCLLVYFCCFFCLLCIRANHQARACVFC